MNYCILLLNSFGVLRNLIITSLLGVLNLSFFIRNMLFPGGQVRLEFLVSSFSSLESSLQVLDFSFQEFIVLFSSLSIIIIARNSSLLNILFKCTCLHFEIDQLFNNVQNILDFSLITLNFNSFGQREQYSKHALIVLSGECFRYICEMSFDLRHDTAVSVSIILLKE